MKKNLFFTALAAVALVGCSSSDLVNEVTENEVAINFDGSYVDHATRNAGEMSTASDNNTFAVDGNTFEVWGWKTVTSGNAQVFDNVTCTHMATSSAMDGQSGAITRWVYSPAKYWDKQASKYMFYAAAPTGAFTLAEDLNTEANRKFTKSDIPGVQVLSDKNGASQILAANTTAVDYLVAGVQSLTTVPPANGEVNFTFNHILSKLNVNVLTTSTFNNTGSNYPQIEVTDLKIYLPTDADCSYAQATAGTVTPSTAGVGGDQWTNGDTRTTATTCLAVGASGNTSGITLTTTGQAVASYLVAPTATAASGTAPTNTNYKIDVTFVVKSSATNTETFTYTNLPITDANLARFIQNYEYTLNITVAPQVILFDVTSVNGFTPAPAAAVTVQ